MIKRISGLEEKLKIFFLAALVFPGGEVTALEGSKEASDSSATSSSQVSAEKEGMEEITEEQQQALRKLIQSVVLKRQLEGALQEGMELQKSVKNYKTYAWVSKAVGAVVAPTVGLGLNVLLKSYKDSIKFGDQSFARGFFAVGGAAVTYLLIDAIFSAAWGGLVSQIAEQSTKMLYSVNNDLSKITSTLRKLKDHYGMDEEFLKRLSEKAEAMKS